MANIKDIKVKIVPEVLKGLDYAKAQTDEFHKAFGHPANIVPTELTAQQVQTRVHFIAEELVEALSAVSKTRTEFFQRVTDLMNAVQQAEEKENEKGIGADDVVVALVDAFTDINVFTQGTFTMMGVEPQPVYDIVMEANMAKLGPDGKPIYRESDGKIMKPEGWEAPEPKIAAEVKNQIEKKVGGK
jgi:predicted HAD superfamily Cof-like phosphohydrolase